MLGHYLTIVRTRVLQNRSLQRGLSATVLAVSIVFLAWKTYSSWDALRNYAWQIRYAWLIPSFVLYLLHMTLTVRAWQAIMNCLGEALPFRQHARVYWGTNLMRRIPAGVLWLVAGRAYAYGNRDVPTHTSILASFLEVWVVVLTGLPLALIAAPCLNLLPYTTGLPLAVAAGLLSLGLLHPTAVERLVQLAHHEDFQRMPTYRNMLSLALGYTLIWLVGGTGLLAVAGLFMDLSLQHLPVTLAAWFVSNMVSYAVLLSPGGLGLRELSLTVLLGVSLKDPLPLLIALAMRLTWTAYDLVVGLAALRL